MQPLMFDLCLVEVGSNTCTDSATVLRMSKYCHAVAWQEYVLS